MRAVLSRREMIAAAGALGLFGSDAREAVPELSELLNSSEKSLRKTAARTLGQIGPDAGAAVPLLQQCLQDSNAQMELTVAMALWRIAGQTEGTADVLAKSISPHLDDSGYSLPEKLAVLGEMGPEAMVAAPTLIKLCKSSHLEPKMRTAAWEALNQISPEMAATIQP